MFFKRWSPCSPDILPKRHECCAVCTSSGRVYDIPTGGSIGLRQPHIFEGRVIGTFMKRPMRLVLTLPVILILATSTVGYPVENTDLHLTSSAFSNGGRIPNQFTCSGENISPALQWAGVPSTAKSLALLVEDPDAPIGTFIHWVFYNLPATTKGLPQNVPTSDTAEGGIQGVNGRGTTGYTGPCPPPGAPHHYHFRLYALDQQLILKSDADANDLKAALNGHVLASTDLVGIFQR
jgi:Raf kinase inhibitor-like YbhB/YbcL family protein